MSDKLFYLLQVNDALFPVGAYSHSQGLETYIQKGIVHDEESAELLAVRLAYESAMENNLEKLMHLEEILEVSRLPVEQREASRKMGSRFAKTIEKLELEITKQGIFHDYLTARKGKIISHCCVYGVFCAAFRLDLENTLSHYLYAQTSAMVTNCVKTIPLSQSSGQKILSGCYGCFQEILSEVLKWTEEDLCLSAPGFDIRGIQHEKLYSRIYMS